MTFRRETRHRMLGIYIHIPFCLKKCGYCDFFSIPIERGALPYEAYLAAIGQQLERELGARDIDGRPVQTIYFGGGTPSLMPPEFFADVLALLRRNFDVAADAEVSCEVNPATADGAWFGAARMAGITRASIGVQSFQPRLLATLGRIHSAEEAMRSIAEAQDAGFESVSVDLMYAIPGETMVDLENDLSTAMTFQPQHLSAYQLTVEEGTTMARAAGASQADVVQLNQMRAVARILSRGGWTRYEISNFAKPGCECRHNLNYWRYGEWLGLGAGATSFLHRRADVPTYQRTVFGRRWTQVRDISAYLTGAAPAELEVIDLPTATGEFCFLGLRTTEGISPARFEAIFGEPFDHRYGETCSELVREGLLGRQGGRFSLTPRGLETANQVFARFV